VILGGGSAGGLGFGDTVGVIDVFQQRIIVRMGIV
jgi:hypothetical protein